MYGLVMIILGAMILFPLLYYIVRGAAKDGTLNALIEYDRLKSEKRQNEQTKS